MAFSNTITVAPNTTGRASLASVLTSAGFTRVTQDYAASGTYTIDVWKSAAANNTAGQDWYLILGDVTSGASHQLAVSVCEGWDDATKLATRYIPNNPSQTPAGDFSIGATGVAPTNTNIYYQMGLSLWTYASGAPGTGIVSATTDRVIIRFCDSQTTPIYAGHVDRTYPTSIDPVQPLGVFSLQGNGSLNTTTSGGCTREPNQTIANASNWRAYIYNLNSVNYRVLNNVTDSITGKPFASLIPISAARFAGTTWRGIFKDMKVSSATAALSDVMTETEPDGSTKSYFFVCNSGGSASQAFWALSV